MVPEAKGAQVLPKHDLPPLKQDCCLGGLGGQDPTKLSIGKARYKFCFINVLPSLTVEAVDALQTLFRAPRPLV